MDPLTAGLTLAPVVLGAFRRKPKDNRRKTIQKYRDSRPVGYTSKEDEAFAERQRAKQAGAAKAVAQQRRAMNANQVRVRGLGGAAAAALEQQATDVEAAGAEDAARSSADLLYRAFQSNLGYERNKNDNAFGAELGIDTQDVMRADAQQAEFWNSVLEGVQATAPMLSKVGPKPAAAPASPGATPTAPVTPAQRRVRGNAGPVYR